MRLLLGALAACLLTASPAAAANPDRPDIPADLTGSLTSANFVVHYRVAGDDAVTQEQAQAVADASEASLAKFQALGFPRPLDDGDGLIDVYYYAYGPASRHGFARREETGQAKATGYIALNTAYSKPLETIKHEIFHLVQYAMTFRDEGWLAESTASWARWQVNPPPAGNFKYLTEDHHRPLNCVEGSGGACEGFGGGYTSWLYFAQFEAQFVKDLYDRILPLALADKQVHGFDVLLAELAERGITLQDSLMNLGTKMVQGTLTDFGAQYANSVELVPDTEIVVVPAAGGASEPATQTVHHASLGFVAVQPRAGACETVPLSLHLQAPADVAGVSFVQRDGAVQPLAIGTTVVPWVACTANPAQVVIANGTTASDDQSFTLTGQVVTPALSRLKVRKRRRALAVTVRSSAKGSLVASLRRGPVRRLPLERGANAFALKLPKGYARRRGTLTLTPAVGAYTGPAVARRVRIAR